MKTVKGCSHANVATHISIGPMPVASVEYKSCWHSLRSGTNHDCVDVGCCRSSTNTYVRVGWILHTSSISSELDAPICINDPLYYPLRLPCTLPSLRGRSTLPSSQRSAILSWTGTCSDKNKKSNACRLTALERELPRRSID